MIERLRERRKEALQDMWRLAQIIRANEGDDGFVENALKFYRIYRGEARHCLRLIWKLTDYTPPSIKHNPERLAA